MPFLGKTPKQVELSSFGTRVKDDFTANGSTTAFTLSKSVANPNDIAVFVGNVRQEPTDAYTVSGTTLTMSEAPATGLNFYVVHTAGTIESSVVPADGTISSAKIASGAVSSSKLDTNIAISGNLTTGNTSIVTGGRFISSQTSNDPWLKGVNSSNTETSYIKKDGQIYSAFGISLGGTGAANTLDDYEEGTWTPSTLVNGFTQSIASYSEAKYTKIGRTVHASCTINISASGYASGYSHIGGLPFTAVGTSVHGRYASGSIGAGGNGGATFAQSGGVYLFQSFGATSTSSAWSTGWYLNFTYEA